LKLVLDEMCDRAIELRTTPDEELLARMGEEKRVVVTENAMHCIPAFRRIIERGEPCAGLLVSPPKSMPRSRAPIGLFVDVIERELKAHPGEASLQDQMAFMRP
jgi:hypothetical protein